MTVYASISLMLAFGVLIIALLSFGQGILVPTDIITEPYPIISAVPERTKIRFDRRTLLGEKDDDFG
ncbi:hypothetical protein J2Y03_004524 [Neobacillus niacini]|uniref:putative holin-like toxin n=1 Tax=Neobacillus niacini TaxID=86668 RepID=UPI00286391CD|nr:putative holin-like toxin [Neobacillus niacini]MDR7079466.1 hypothetical protein [Neobacillus niacini]